MIAPLTQPELTQALSELREWTYDKDRKALYRQLRLKDFAQAIGLMMRIAIEAEKNDHHPEWSNVYNRIDIWLTTHDASGVSARDVKLATIIDAMI